MTLAYLNNASTDALFKYRKYKYKYAGNICKPGTQEEKGSTSSSQYGRPKFRENLEYNSK
jgi:hypothetical protein